MYIFTNATVGIYQIPKLQDIIIAFMYLFCNYKWVGSYYFITNEERKTAI